MKPTQIRLRIIITIFIVILPVFIYVVLLGINDHKIAENQAIEKLSLIAKVTSSEHSQFIDSAKHLLTALSISPEIISYYAKNCSPYLEKLNAKYQRYSSIAVVNPQGRVICSSDTKQIGRDLSNTYVYKHTQINRVFSVGDYRTDPITNQAVISLAFPLIDINNQLFGMVISSLDLDWLNNLSSNSPTILDHNTVLTIIDNNGTVLVRKPDSTNWLGKQFPLNSLKIITNDTAINTLESTGIDGENRLYAVQKLSSNENSPYVLVGLPDTVINRDSNQILLSRLLVLLLITAATIVIGISISNQLIVKQIKALTELDKLKDDFVSLLSHQIRTPLTSILWFSEILLKNPKTQLNSKSKSLVKDIHQSTTYSINLIGTLLDISKIESGKMPLNLSPINPQKLIKNIFKNNHQEIKKNKLTIKLSISRSLPILLADQNLLTQALQNLVSNAIKYSQPNNAVNISIYRRQEMIIFQITDRGIGIKKDDQGRIFCKFSRTDTAIFHSPEGSGLGLYLTKLIAREHHGDVWFSSVPNKTTSFFLGLPIDSKLIS